MGILGNIFIWKHRERNLEIKKPLWMNLMDSLKIH